MHAGGGGPHAADRRWDPSGRPCAMTPNARNKAVRGGRRTRRGRAAPSSASSGFVPPGDRLARGLLSGYRAAGGERVHSGRRGRRACWRARGPAGHGHAAAETGTGTGAGLAVCFRWWRSGVCKWWAAAVTQTHTYGTLFGRRRAKTKRWQQTATEGRGRAVGVRRSHPGRRCGTDERACCVGGRGKKHTHWLVSRQADGLRALVVRVWPPTEVPRIFRPRAMDDGPCIICR